MNKKTTNNLALLLFATLFAGSVSAQNMAINISGNPGNAAAVLDMSDASNAHLGLLLPNVSLSSVTDVTTIPSPVDGLIVYNTNASIGSGFGVGFYYWSATSTQWLFVSNTGAPGVTTFSAGTTGFTPNTATSGAVTLGGILNVANGGTGLGTSPTNGQLLIGNGTGYGLATITSANGTIAITNGAGTIALDLAQQGATTNQVLAWSGTQWAPQNLSSIGLQNLSPGTGLSGSTYNGSTAVNDWSVLYGSTANTAVQGNTTFSVTAGTGLSGGGSITEGTGGTVTLNNTGVLSGTGTSPISVTGTSTLTVSFPSWPADAAGVLTDNGTGGLSWGSSSSLGNITVTNSGGGLNITGSPVSLGGTINVDPNVVTNSSLTGNGTTATPLGLASVITAGGPTGSGSVVPVITYNAQGQLTAVSTATITASSIGLQNLSQGTGITAFTYNGSATATVGLANGSAAGQVYVTGNSPFTPVLQTMNGDATISAAGGMKVNALESSTTSVNVSSATAPTSGQVLTATSGTAATWQTPTTYSGTNFILNQTTQQASSNFNISGTGTIGGLATINGGITVLGSTNINNTSAVNATSINATSGNSGAVAIGNTSTTSLTETAVTTKLTNGTTGGTLTVGTANNNVGVGTATPTAGAALDVSSTTQGILIPRMASNPTTPATSMMYYNTTTNCFMFYTGSAWQNMFCACSGVPATPTITGSTSICLSSTGNVYSIASNTATSYTWTVPSAVGTLVSGQGTSAITVTAAASAGSGSITVTAINACGTSAAGSLTVSAVGSPATPIITGPSGACPSQTGLVYSVPLITGATYTWTVPSGASITAGAGTNSITVTAGSTSGNVTCIETLCSQTSGTGTLAVTYAAHGTASFSYGGSIVNFTVPSCAGNVTIVATGAGGGYGSAVTTAADRSKGAVATGTFSGLAGQTLSILVGQSPGAIGSATYPGGGGGSFVALGATYSTATALIVGGGGGGQYANSATVAAQNGQTSNVSPWSGGGSNPGTNGNGAGANSTYPCDGGGGGFLTSGAADYDYGYAGGAGFYQGGAGGLGASSSYQNGGFGGGAPADYAASCNSQAGAAGGYSGGSGNGTGTQTYGNGGSSYIVGTATATSIVLAASNANGTVTITY